VAGLDFPFGQPRKLIRNLRWPSSWAGYVRQVGKVDADGFKQRLDDYRQRIGHKYEFRVIDQKAGAQSAMNLVRPPVGKMFFQGMPRLLKSGVNVQPCHLTDSEGVVVEAYPALVAGKWTANKPRYKNDKPAQQCQAHWAARQTILDGICSARPLDLYGLTLELGEDLAECCLTDANGDTLDAVLCAIQAAWAYRRRHQGYGIPADCYRPEGWIVDPELLAA
jgi:Protein of unknown function (DUF429)